MESARQFMSRQPRMFAVSIAPFREGRPYEGKWRLFRITSGPWHEETWPSQRLECSRFEWIEPDESNGARLRSEATAQRAPFKLQKV